MSERRRSLFAPAAASVFVRDGEAVRVAVFGRGGSVRARPVRLRFRFFATYGAIELKSNSDGMGSGSSSSVPYVTTITS
jgi:hypothetical protein